MYAKNCKYEGRLKNVKFVEKFGGQPPMKMQIYLSTKIDLLKKQFSYASSMLGLLPQAAMLNRIKEKNTTRVSNLYQILKIIEIFSAVIHNVIFPQYVGKNINFCHNISKLSIFNPKM